MLIFCILLIYFSQKVIKKILIIIFIKYFSINLPSWSIAMQNGVLERGMSVDEGLPAVGTLPAVLVH
jgi:hypothetical protein